MDFTQLLLSPGHKYVLVTVSTFSHWTSAFPCRWATVSSMANSPFGKKYLYQGTHSHTPQWLGNPCDQSGALTSLCCLVDLTVLLHLLSSIFKFSWHTNHMPKTRLAKFIETCQICWWKAVPLDILNLRYTPFGIYKLLPFEIIIGHAMHLAPDSFDPLLINWDTLYSVKT